MVENEELCDRRGYKYDDKNGNTYVELHVYEHPIFQDECNHLPFGGHLSVQKKEEKPVMLLGQDKCIFKQFCLTKKSWSDPNGTRALLPKDKGQGVMISAITSQELGFGMELSPDQLALVNQRRKRVGNKHCLDKDAAIAKKWDYNKPITYIISIHSISRVWY
jgi:hypothetical protein